MTRYSEWRAHHYKSIVIFVDGIAVYVMLDNWGPLAHAKVIGSRGELDFGPNKDCRDPQSLKAVTSKKITTSISTESYRANAQVLPFNMDPYYNIDAILTDAQKVPCIFHHDIPGLGYLDENPGGDVHPPSSKD
jgi:hypothetical protein